jgi:transaldolase
MKFFVDTADINEIKDLASTGLLDGVTTNPSLVAASGAPNFIALIEQICDVVDGPVSAEVAATDYDTMLKEGQKLAKIAKNVAVKLPLTPDGLKVCHKLADAGTMTNVTLCFSPAQALLAAKAGATFISPFVGRLDDVGADGVGLLEDIRTLYDIHDYGTEILAASVRNADHVTAAALAGADASTIPADVFKALVKHPLTDKGLDAFLADWGKTGQSIL